MALPLATRSRWVAGATTSMDPARWIPIGIAEPHTNRCSHSWSIAPIPPRTGMFSSHRIDHGPGAFGHRTRNGPGGRAPNEGRWHKIPGRNHGPASQGTSDAFPVNGQKAHCGRLHLEPTSPASPGSTKIRCNPFSKTAWSPCALWGVFLAQRSINLEQFFHAGCRPLMKSNLPCSSPWYSAAKSEANEI